MEMLGPGRAYLRVLGTILAVTGKACLRMRSSQSRVKRWPELGVLTCATVPGPASRIWIRHSEKPTGSDGSK